MAQKFNSIQEVTDALARQEIDSAAANEAILALTARKVSIETGPKGTCVAKLQGRSFPLASLYKDEWAALLDMEVVSRIQEYIAAPSNRVKSKNE